MHPCLLLLAPLVSAKFTPGPGLKENPDGTYSRTYDAAAEGAAAGAGGGGEGESNPVYNVLFTIALVLAWYLYHLGVVGGQKSDIWSTACPHQQRQSLPRPSRCLILPCESCV